MTEEIFLLSIEEYKKYKNNIPQINTRWWLRSPGYTQSNAASVDRDGSVNYLGSYVDLDFGCVRPALRLKSSKYNIGHKIYKYGYTWIVIGDNLAISEMPIAIRRFDEYNNDYESSEIRQFLLNWYEERKYIFDV